MDKIKIKITERRMIKEGDNKDGHWQLWAYGVLGSPDTSKASSFVKLDVGKIYNVDLLQNGQYWNIENPESVLDVEPESKPPAEPDSKAAYSAADAEAIKAVKDLNVAFGNLLIKLDALLQVLVPGSGSR